MEIMGDLYKRKELVLFRFKRLHLATQWRRDYGVKAGGREFRRRLLL